MESYIVPFQEAETEMIEKRSRFIGHVWPVESEEQARALIEATKKKYHDARHNCWCYIIREGNILRYSDDGEPQGTAGQPMLGVFQREEVTNVCCVVTRYFGGIQLGAGGLVRAYSHAAVLALEAAHIVTYEKYAQMRLMISYSDYSRYLSELEKSAVIIDNTVFEENVIIEFAVKKTVLPNLEARLVEMSGGKLKMLPNGERFDFR